MFDGGWSREVPGSPSASGVRAISAATGEFVWEMEAFENRRLSNAGILVTAGDLVFTANSTGAILLARDAATGEELWKMALGGRITMGPMTYLYEGRQHLAVIVGATLFVLDLVGQQEG
jgi:alcohol dehydrogenase (cytochrome c)